MRGLEIGWEFLKPPDIIRNGNLYDPMIVHISIYLSLDRWPGFLRTSKVGRSLNTRLQAGMEKTTKAIIWVLQPLGRFGGI